MENVVGQLDGGAEQASFLFGGWAPLHGGPASCEMGPPVLGMEPPLPSGFLAIAPPLAKTFGEEGALAWRQALALKAAERSEGAFHGGGIGAPNSQPLPTSWLAKGGERDSGVSVVSRGGCFRAQIPFIKRGRGFS